MHRVYVFGIVFCHHKQFMNQIVCDHIQLASVHFDGGNGISLLFIVEFIPILTTHRLFHILLFEEHVDELIGIRPFILNMPFGSIIDLLFSILILNFDFHYLFVINFDFWSATALLAVNWTYFVAFMFTFWLAQRQRISAFLSLFPFILRLGNHRLSLLENNLIYFIF